MTATLDRPPRGGPRSGRPAGPTPPPAGPVRGTTPGSAPPDRTLALELSVLGLVAAAAVSLGLVFATAEWVRPTVGAVLVAHGVAAVCRRTRLTLAPSVLLQVSSLLVYLGVVFVPATMFAAVVPTPSTVRALAALAYEGLAIIPERVAPTAVVPPLALLAVGGAGAIAVVTDLLAHAGRAPLKAVIVALTMWAVPLSMLPPGGMRWTVAVPMLVAVGAVLLASSGTDVGRWGRWIYPRGSNRNAGGTFGPTGLVLGSLAIAAGLALASSLPGYGQPPWWMVGGRGGSTLAANPIVQMRSNLVASGTEPIFTVTTPRPVYLRTTALDTYGEFEEWTSSGIRTQPLQDGIMARGTVDSAFDVTVRIGDVARAELVPMPYQPLRVSGGVSDRFQFDPSTGTVALDEGAVLEPGDEYDVLTAVPQPSAEQLGAAGQRLPGHPLTELPEDVPPEVGELAARIIEEAEATSPFEQALAIQNELRTWQYSTDPPPGHDGDAMLGFLENRVGYCEQFAGTMAVMLRTLDLPARVAVGFTPGQLTSADSSTYTVAWSNSHAWVEMWFPDLGWISFEPTPRGDGNVLVPTSGNPAPTSLQEDPVPADPSVSNPYANSGLAQPGDDILSADQLARQRGQASPAATGGDAGPSPLGWVLLLAAAGVAVTGFVGWRRLSAGPDPTAPPADRILAAGRRVSRVGAGLGLQVRASETDREYMRRLAVGTSSGLAGEQLAAALTRARYAPSVDLEDAGRAERAAETVVTELTRGLSAPRRAVVLLRGGASERWTKTSEQFRGARWWPRGAGATER